MRSLYLTLFAMIVLGIAPIPAAEPELGTVEGKVTYQGKPLEDATIAFHLADGQFVGAKIKDGNYKVDRVPAGTVKVTVQSKKDAIPAKFGVEDATPLKFEVKAGKNTANFELSD